jgi:twinkle protein
MSECIEKLEHSRCGHTALQVFQADDDTYNGYCFHCDEFIPNPYEGGEPTPVKRFKRSAAEIKSEIEAISQYQTVDLPDRKLKKTALKYFGVTIGLSEQDGVTPVTHHYPYYKAGELVAFKSRLIEQKQFWSLGNMCDVELFGWTQAIATGAKTLYITEGELDAVALYQALKKKAAGGAYAAFDPAVVSLIKGIKSAKKDLVKMLPSILANFKEVVLVFDQDPVGLETIEEVMQLIPYAKTVTLPAKDPNECLIKGFGVGLANAVLFKKEKPKNTRLVWGRDLIASAREETPWGLSYPWDRLSKLTRGIRFGETIYIGAGVKMGKTTIVDTLIAHLITEHNIKVFAVQPEDINDMTFKRVVGKVAKRVFTDPEIPFDYEAYDKVAPVIGESLLCLNMYQELDWTTLRTDIMAAVDQGCRAVFIDPITNITNGMVAGEANSLLQEFAQGVSSLAKDLDIMVFLFCHLNAPKSGEPHERGGRVMSSQFAGSRAMMRSCHVMMGLEGNKDPDLPPEEQNIRRLVILEERRFGASGYCNLFYDTKLGILTEINGV